MANLKKVCKYPGCAAKGCFGDVGAFCLVHGGEGKVSTNCNVSRKTGGGKVVVRPTNW